MTDGPVHAGYSSVQSPVISWSIGLDFKTLQLTLIIIKSDSLHKFVLSCGTLIWTPTILFTFFFFSTFHPPHVFHHLYFGSIFLPQPFFFMKKMFCGLWGPQSLIPFHNQ